MSNQIETIKFKVLNAAGHTLMTCDAAPRVSLVYTAAYCPGDRIALEINTPGRYCWVQFEDSMPEALVYIQKREINFHIPFAEQAITYSPKSFTGDRHVIRARLAEPWEIATRRNLAFNPYDEHGDTGFFPHASANVETRGEAVFAARNAIDGIFENSSHGEYPYQSWGINRDPNAELHLDFGRPVVLDELRLTLRGGLSPRQLLDLCHGGVLRRGAHDPLPDQRPGPPALPPARPQDGHRAGAQGTDPGGRAFPLPRPDPD